MAPIEPIAPTTSIAPITVISAIAPIASIKQKTLLRHSFTMVAGPASFGKRLVLYKKKGFTEDGSLSTQQCRKLLSL